MNFLYKKNKDIKFTLSHKVKLKTHDLYYQEIKGLTKRLFIQIFRRPFILIISTVQPLLWLLLFSALFQNAPITFYTSTYKYKNFISAGIIVFTIFTASLNAGLPIIFDREFGFLNRFLCSPITTRYSIIIASCLNIIILSMSQVSIIMIVCQLMGTFIININNLLVITIILFLFSNCVTSTSLIFAIILPGHIELLAFIIIINLPLLFSSTALAPLVFMPAWLQVVASINPLSYVIEIIRYNNTLKIFNTQSIIMNTVWGTISLQQVLIIFCILNSICFTIAQNLISKKFDE
jgi:ABC-2 type transport system permease protein|uniref:ABC-2 type transporter n=1 Tax=Thorea hispida TaxID=202687 RepID=A0A1C9CAR0_9FLOR|nr:ABC-2 type transporter [Thorea hispida]AOM65455.1 ABC-2 type transporter [Thorea hispida]ARX95824.1 ABC-2 type transporter [Thorea hispida]UNJ79110.1 ABC-2 type transporter [Thorea hispida]